VVENVVVVDPIMGVHIFAGIGALFIGIVLIFLVTAGDWYNKLGRFWQFIMLVLVLTSFDIRLMNQGELSPIHGVSIFVLALILVEIWASINQRQRTQRFSMIGSFVTLIVVLVAIIASPGGVINQWFFA